MRGTRIELPCRRPVKGIIPADAGNTFDTGIEQISIWDHPRGCGEHINEAIYGKPGVGSSPRMRGTHMRSACCALA